MPTYNHSFPAQGIETFKRAAKSLPVEPFCTVREAAERLNIHYWLLLRAVKNGEVPAYTVGNSRKRVRLSEVVEAIEASRT